jgi:hypothetical protein
MALLSAASGAQLSGVLVRIDPQAVTGTQARELLDAGMVAFLGEFASGVLGAVAAVGFAWVVARDYLAQPSDLVGAGRQAIGRALPAMAAQSIATAAVLGIVALASGAIVAVLTALAPDGVSQGGVGVFLAILIAVATALAVVYLGVRWSLVIPAVALEPVGPLRSLARSWRLTADHVWRTFAVMLLTALMVSILAALVAQLLALVFIDGLGSLGRPEGSPVGFDPVAETVIAAIATVLFAPVTPVVMTVLYYDQRVRLERWDVPRTEPAPAVDGSSPPVG